MQQDVISLLNLARNQLLNGHQFHRSDVAYFTTNRHYLIFHQNFLINFVFVLSYDLLFVFISNEAIVDLELKSSDFLFVQSFKNGFG